MNDEFKRNKNKNILMYPAVTAIVAYCFSHQKLKPKRKKNAKNSGVKE